MQGNTVDIAAISLLCTLINATKYTFPPPPPPPPPAPPVQSQAAAMAAERRQRDNEWCGCDWPTDAIDLDDPSSDMPRRISTAAADRGSRAVEGDSTVICLDNDQDGDRNSRQDSDMGGDEDRDHGGGGGVRRGSYTVAHVTGSGNACRQEGKQRGELREGSLEEGHKTGEGVNRVEKVGSAELESQLRVSPGRKGVSTSMGEWQCPACTLVNRVGNTIVYWDSELATRNMKRHVRWPGLVIPRIRDLIIEQWSDRHARMNLKMRSLCRACALSCCELKCVLFPSVFVHVVRVLHGRPWHYSATCVRPFDHQMSDMSASKANQFLWSHWSSKMVQRAADARGPDGASSLTCT